MPATSWLVNLDFAGGDGTIPPDTNASLEVTKLSIGPAYLSQLVQLCPTFHATQLHSGPSLNTSKMSLS